MYPLIYFFTRRGNILWEWVSIHKLPMAFIDTIFFTVMNAPNFSRGNRRMYVMITFLIFSFSASFSFAQISLESMTRDDRAEVLMDFSEKDAPGERVIAPPETVHTGSSHLKTNACPAAFNMNTPYNSNNGQRGCMFDILAANAVTIRCFESNVYAGTTANYEIYYRAGTHVGFENNAANWTFLGGATGITSAGNNLPTVLPIPINIVIPAGQRYSFYITNDFGGGTSYTDGTAVGNFWANDANLTVFEGVGKSYPFGLTFNVRNFNGTIFYDLGSVLDGESAQLNGSMQGKIAALDWEVPTHGTYSSMALEQSLDGLQFEGLANLPVAAAGSWQGEINDNGQPQFFRLSMVDHEGSKYYSNAVELSNAMLAEPGLKAVFPNPFNDQISMELIGQVVGQTQFSLLDAMGKVVATRQNEIPGDGQLILWDLPSLPSGVYTLVWQTSEKTITQRLVRQ